MSTYVQKQLVKYRTPDHQIAFVNLAMRFLSGLDGAEAVPRKQGLEIQAISEPALNGVLSKCYGFFPGDIDAGSPEVIPHPHTGASPIMHAQFTTPWSCLRHLRLRLLERGVTITASGPADGLIDLYAVGPQELFLGIHDEVAQLTENKGTVEVTFSHYAFWGGMPPDGGSAA
jgi:hypothetical protein